MIVTVWEGGELSSNSCHTHSQPSTAEGHVCMYVCMYVDTVARSRASENNNQGLYFLKNE